MTQPWFLKQKLAVFLDTTVFEAEVFDFDARHLQAVRALAADGYVDVVLTDVTKREIEAHIDESVQVAIQGLSAIRKKRQHWVLRHYGPLFASLFQKHDAVDLAQQLRDRFDAFCKEAGIKVLATGDLRVSPLLDDYFSKTPPFGEGRKKSEFPDAIAAKALDEWKTKNRREIVVVSADKDWQKVCETNERFLWRETIAEFLSYFPDKELAEKIKHALFESKDFQNELSERFSMLDFTVPDGKGIVETVTGVQTEVKKVLVTGAANGTATADIRFAVSYHVQITYNIPGSGLRDEGGRWVYPPDTGEVEFTISTHWMAQVELTYDEMDPSKFEVSEVTFEDDEVEVDIDDVLKAYEPEDEY